CGGQAASLTYAGFETPLPPAANAAVNATGSCAGCGPCRPAQAAQGWGGVGPHEMPPPPLSFPRSCGVGGLGARGFSGELRVDDQGYALGHVRLARRGGDPGRPWARPGAPATRRISSWTAARSASATSAAPACRQTSAASASSPSNASDVDIGGRLGASAGRSSACGGGGSGFGGFGGLAEESEELRVNETVALNGS
uniref:SRCR domain-containing protein n=1 Tax=Macrostomum lignano TaxID=282301 RepID=A0A1I8F5H5_9PLAT